MKVLIPAVFLIIIAGSCKVTEQNIAGTYRLNTPSKTKLVLNSDKTFEFIKNFPEPGPVFFSDSMDLNFRTAGNWHLDNGQLVLNSFPKETDYFTELARDSISKNTDITSFSFWDQYGDAVPIRLIRFPANRTKLHKGNIISFFAEDFVQTDTLEFHFYGYMPYRWISTGHATKSNNQHRITLYEQNRQGYFNKVVFWAERKKLTSADKTFSLYKSE